MKANPILLQMKYTRVIDIFANKAGITLDKALDFFYNSKEYDLISKGIADLHCMSDDYLADDLLEEYTISLKQSVKKQSMPFEIKEEILNDETIEALKSSEKDEDIYGPFDSVKQLMESLNA